MEKFEMVAKTFAGLEDVLAEELRGLGAENVEPGRRVVTFDGDLEMLYRANLCCRTALRILKPFYKFSAHTPDELYEQAKEYDWGKLLSVDKTFCIDSVVNSDEFTHSQFVTYRIKDAIADWFTDRYGEGQRPGVRLKDADIMINVHIAGGNVILSLDSSGESLHKRGYRVAQTEAPINEVLAAGIILMSGWRGDCPFVDPMCGSGTFLIEAAMIAANINPGIYRKSFAFESWPDFDQELFDKLYNDDSAERDVAFPIVGADISAAAVEISRKNAKSAGVSKYIEFSVMPIAKWEEAPQPAGVLITNPPYGERISVPDMEGLYDMIGNRLKNVFQGYHAWIIGYKDEYFHSIGLSASTKVTLYNGSLECELREYVMFAGDKRSYLAAGGSLKSSRDNEDDFADDFDDEEEGYADRRIKKRERQESRPTKERKFRDSADDRGGFKSRKFDGDRRDRKDRRDDRKERKFDRERKFDGGESKYGNRSRRYEDNEDRQDRSYDNSERRERTFERRDNDGRERSFERRDDRRFSRDDRRDGDRRERRLDRDDRREGDRRERRFDRDDRRGGERRERRFDRDDRRDGERRFDRDDHSGERRFDRRDDRRDRRDEQESENPLAKRRNEHAINSIQNKQPSLPPSDGPVMRSRGWKKKS